MEIKIPEFGESVYEALLVKWLRQDGDMVQKDDALCEIETDKVTVELNAEADGRLSIRVEEGETVKIGTVIGTIDESEKEDESPSEEPSPEKADAEEGKPEPATSEAAEAEQAISPAARRLIEEHHLEPGKIKGSGREGRISHEDVLSHLEQRQTELEEAERPDKEPESKPPPQQPEPRREERKERKDAPPAAPSAAGRETTRKPMTPIRRRIAERLLAARQQTAMLTTFNEADLGGVIDLRNKYKEEFRQRHGVALGFMSFFVKACTLALKEFPEVNARIDGSDIVYQHFHDIGIAIGGEKGLVVPVIRDADRLHLAEIERTIEEFVEKVQKGSLTMTDLEGGTFTISNGGVYGSLLSTPILNPPQSAILGMHAIQQRPVAVDGHVVIRPMMYLALSYDHRIIDGRQSVRFLRKIKDLIEAPERMFLLEG